MARSFKKLPPNYQAYENPLLPSCKCTCDEGGSAGCPVHDIATSDDFPRYYDEMEDPDYKPR